MSPVFPSKRPRFAPRRRLRGLALALAASLMASCAKPATMAASLGGPVASGTLSGQVDAPGLAIAAVSLLDPATGHPIATATPDGGGNFGMTPGDVEPGRLYDLDVSAGPSTSRIHLRTLVEQTDGGWASLTGTGGAPVVVDEGTTAMTMVAHLRRGTPRPLSIQNVQGVSNLMGTVDPAGGAAGLRNGQAIGVTAQEFASAYHAVESALGAHHDPLHALGYDLMTQSIAAYAVPLAVFTGITPSTGAPGTSFTLYGENFDTTLTHDAVQFDGGVDSLGGARPAVSANLTSVSATSMSGTIPVGALSGYLTIRVATVVYLGPSYLVQPAITGFSPPSGYTGTQVTLTGSGFDPYSTTVTMPAAGGGSVTATVATASFTTLTVVVPAAAITGPFTVTTAGGSATSSSFTVLPDIASATPLLAATGSTVVLAGTAFSQGTLTMTIGGVAVTPTWTDTSVTFTVPSNQATGSNPVIVTNAAGASNTFTLYVGSQTGTSMLDPQGNLYVSQWLAGEIAKVAPGGTYVEWATGLGTIGGVLVHSNGNVYCANKAGQLYKIPLSTGAVTALATVPVSDEGLELSEDASGNIWAMDEACGNSTSHIYEINPTTGSYTTLTTSSPLTGTGGIAIDSSGNFYTASWNSSNAYQISSTGTILKTWTLPASANFGSAVDTQGNAYFANNSGAIYKVVISTGAISTWVTLPYGTLRGLSNFDPSGNLYCSAQGNGPAYIEKITPSLSVSSLVNFSTGAWW